MKRILSVFVAVIMVFSLVTPVLGATFRDVPNSHFAFEAVSWVSNPENGAFMVGDAGNNFHPGRHLNKFDAVQIFAMAAGFRHVTHNLPQEEREVFARAFETWSTFLDGMAQQFSSWNRTVDREIAFLLYREILTTDDVMGFVQIVGAGETRPLLTREQAVVWMVRLMGQSAHAQAVSLPHHTPFRDDAQITPAFRRYIYHARELGIIQGAGGYVNPRAHFTRAEMAVVFHNALAEEPEVTAVATGEPGTVSGTITNVFRDTHVSIVHGAGTDTFSIAPNAVIMIDNTQRTAPFLREGMAVTALVDAERQVISLVARSGETAAVTGEGATGIALNSDEGFVTNFTHTPETVTIRTRRVRIDGHIIDEERTFTIAPGATITRGGAAAYFADIQTNDIAFFNFTGTIIHELELMERERTILGILAEVRPPDTAGGNPILVIEETEGRAYELRVLPATEISRGTATALNWYDLRIGDAVTAEAEFDRLITVQATGTRSTATGRLNELRITELSTELSITQDNGTRTSFFVRPGVFDVYTLRIGNQLSIDLDSREVVNITQAANQAQPLYIIGFIQAIRPDNTILIVEGQGQNARTHTISINNATAINRAGANLSFTHLRVNMNVYIVLTAPQSNTARSLTILP
jgi:hypothetical protein